MRIHKFESELWLPLSLEEAFRFFADATNLEATSPPWLHFHIVTPQPIAIYEEVLIDYRLRVRGLPLRWRRRINVWESPHRFVDEQLRGPYRRCIHEHTFEARDGGTLTRDVVHYAVPFDFIAHRWFVHPDVEKFCGYRAEALKKRFGDGHGKKL